MLQSISPNISLKFDWTTCLMILLPRNFIWQLKPYVKYMLPIPVFVIIKQIHMGNSFLCQTISYNNHPFSHIWQTKNHCLKVIFIQCCSHPMTFVLSLCTRITSHNPGSWFSWDTTAWRVENWLQAYIPDNKVHGANMGPAWVLSATDGPHEPCY